VFFTIGSAIEVDPAPTRRAALKKELGVADLLYPERRLRDFAQRYAIHFVPLIEPMQRYATSEHVYLHGFSDTGLGRGHWNERGHAVAADLLAGPICGAVADPVVAGARSQTTVDAR